jgi:GNAT superfamily N-acetyltransferase
MDAIPAPAEGAPMIEPEGQPAGPHQQDPRARALEFQRELEDSLATRVEETAWGAAVFRDDLPRVTGLNLLRVSSGPEDVDAEALMSQAEVLQAGLPHRSIRVEGDRTAAHLAPDFAAAGWTFERTALMVLRRRPDRPIDTSAAARVELERIRGAREAAIRHRHRDLEVAAEVVEAGALAHQTVPVSAMAAIVGSEVAAYCLVRTGAGAAKLTEVFALGRAQGRGVGLAVIAAAAAAARASGPPGTTMVFVESEHDEWAKSIYRRLGFDERGAMYRFIRPWGDEGWLPPPL